METEQWPENLIQMKQIYVDGVNNVKQSLSWWPKKELDGTQDDTMWKNDDAVPVPKAVTVRVTNHFRNKIMTVRAIIASRVARDKPWSTLCKKSHGIPSSPRVAAVDKFRLLTGHDCLCAHLFRFNLVTSPICVLCDTGQDMTAAHLDECSALNDLNCIVKRRWDGVGTWLPPGVPRSLDSRSGSAQSVSVYVRLRVRVSPNRGASRFI
ncbi:uncharacterized protein TNCV_2867721 [Trichonephila clavipes]|nr:uncharacterized protein TNCV_2867721 [Trichonephila clavipes]